MVAVLDSGDLNYLQGEVGNAGKRDWCFQQLQMPGDTCGGLTPKDKNARFWGQEWKDLFSDAQRQVCEPATELQGLGGRQGWGQASESGGSEQVVSVSIREHRDVPG